VKFKRSAHFCALLVQCTKMCTSFGPNIQSTNSYSSDVHCMCSAQKCALHMQCTLMIFCTRQLLHSCPMLPAPKKGLRNSGYGHNHTPEERGDGGGRRWRRQWGAMTTTMTAPSPTIFDAVRVDPLPSRWIRDGDSPSKTTRSRWSTSDVAD
jgi:hypothetical protein